MVIYVATTNQAGKEAEEKEGDTERNYSNKRRALTGRAEVVYRGHG